MSEPRHALVCGASAGIGRAAALVLGNRGLRVTALARRRDLLASLCLELSAGGAPDPSFVTADHDDLDGLARVAGEILAGRGAVHVLVNNSGGPPPGRLIDSGSDALLAAFSRHVLASHLLVRAVLPGMTAAGYGRIVNVVSISAREPIPGLGVSNTVRAAMAGWAKTLAMELPPGITINNVLPGYTATDRLRSLAGERAAGAGLRREDVERQWREAVPEGRLGRPEEIAAVVAFLASPEASYVRGQSLAADGGRLRSI
ncbi:MAG: SDR family oxidoreductase [Planctomycetes bacterium]|jgi:3-oxoacyl-[acyl-carrier protein] reductase|nr:SDR family oxidoreductase [Planctomycetota bacterium]